MACPICKKKNKIFSIKVNDYEYNVKDYAVYAQCVFCKSIYRNKPKKINKRKEKNLYTKNRYLPIKGNFIYDLLKDLYSNKEKKEISKYLDKSFFNKKRTIVDLACGKGYLIKKFSKNQNFLCYGIDTNIKTFTQNNMNFAKSSYNDFKFIKKLKPDLIIINNFIEHVENLKNINRIIYQMKKNSFLIVITPDSNCSARKIFMNYWSGYHSPRHKIIFNEKSMKIFISKNKNISYEQKKIYDPFSNFVSISNIIKNISIKSLISDIFRIFNYFFYILIDLFQKNRLLLKVKKI